MSERRRPDISFGIYGRTGGVYLRALEGVMYKDAFYLDVVAAASLSAAIDNMDPDSPFNEGLIRCAAGAWQAVWDGIDG